MIKQELNESIKAVTVLRGFDCFGVFFFQIWMGNWTENKHLGKYFLWGQWYKEFTSDGAGVPSSTDSDYSTTHVSLSCSIWSWRFLIHREEVISTYSQTFLTTSILIQICMDRKLLSASNSTASVNLKQWQLLWSTWKDYRINQVLPALQKYNKHSW